MFVQMGEAMMTIRIGGGILLGILMAVGGQAREPRQALSLDGQWEIGEGTRQQMPARFDHDLFVPDHLV